MRGEDGGEFDGQEDLLAIASEEAPERRLIAHGFQGQRGGGEGERGQGLGGPELCQQFARVTGEFRGEEFGGEGAVRHATKGAGAARGLGGPCYASFRFCRMRVVARALFSV